MSQQEIEVILTRQLATYLAMPIFVVGPDGTLVFYNEPAEAILGCRFDETGALSVDEWMRLFKATDEHGAPLPPGERPVLVAVLLSDSEGAQHVLGQPRILPLAAEAGDQGSLLREMPLAGGDVPVGERQVGAFLLDGGHCAFCA